ncbi:MAG: TetR/AcrR family transcriptional regulator [Bacteroidales bacterium]|jgi:AcrR family transcriptional regulator|nr:TetR/AcrR family transcriptional regulator [Bacteroidales bacterium]
MRDKTANTRQIILGTARSLFWKHGFRRVSVEEICESCEISKMTFYRYFPNKIELAKTVFLTVIEESYSKFREITDSSASPEEKINSILLLKFEGTTDISEEFLNDFYSENDSGLHDFVKSATSDIWKKIVGDLKSAQRKGIFREDINFEFFFYLSQKIAGILNDPEIIRLFESPRDMIMETARLLMYGIAPRKQ